MGKGCILKVSYPYDTFGFIADLDPFIKSAEFRQINKRFFVHCQPNTNAEYSGSNDKENEVEEA